MINRAATAADARMSSAHRNRSCSPPPPPPDLSVVLALGVGFFPVNAALHFCGGVAAAIAVFDSFGGAWSSVGALQAASSAASAIAAAAASSCGRSVSRRLGLLRKVSFRL